MLTKIFDKYTSQEVPIFTEWKYSKPANLYAVSPFPYFVAFQAAGLWIYDLLFCDTGANS